MTHEGRRWNHNIHYHPVLVRAVPPVCRNALDVGCGEGMLVRELRAVAGRVTGIDLDRPSIQLARIQDPGNAADYVLGDFCSEPFDDQSFDFVASVSALHHMDAGEALRRMASLLRPGGTLAVVGVTRTELPRDLAYEACAVAANLRFTLTKSYWEHSAPTVWPPPNTYREMRSIARSTLPGVRFRRHLLWRFSLTWTKPIA